ncbi:MAG: DUF2029 domain-containing protein [Clostridia bacterium]|nr:DUF2029 domain-containing protein [Clostridia bacterium]
MLKKRNTHRLQSDSNTLVGLFIIIAALGVFLSFELAVMTRGRTIQYSLFWNNVYSDHFMDFFNTLRDSRDLSWIYQRNVIYPPLSVLFMYLMTKFLPPELVSLPFNERYTLQRSQGAVVLYFFVATLSILMLAVFIDRYLQKNDVGFERLLIVLFSIVSFPVIYCMERGNLSLLAAALSAYFVFFRNSENKWVRELSYIALAVAAGFKLFPAALGVLLLYEKKFFPAVRTVIYGVLCFILPYLISKLLIPADGTIAQAVAQGATVTHTNGAEVSTDGSIGRFLKNLLRWVIRRSTFSYNSTSISNIAYFFTQAELISARRTQPVGLALFVLTEVFAFFAGFFCKKEWQRVFIATYLMLNIHSIAMHYTLIYVLPVLVVFLAQERRSRKKADILCLLLLAVQVVPIPYLIYHKAAEIQSYLWFNWHVDISGSFNKSLSCIAFQLTALVIMLDIIICFFKARKGAAAKSAEYAVA